MVLGGSRWFWVVLVGSGGSGGSRWFWWFWVVLGGSGGFAVSGWLQAKNQKPRRAQKVVKIIGFQMQSGSFLGWEGGGMLLSWVGGGEFYSRSSGAWV